MIERVRAHGRRSADWEAMMDQETAIELLRERYARGGVSLEEYRQLMGKLLVTTDPIECQALLDELPPAPEDIPGATANDDRVGPHVFPRDGEDAGRRSSQTTSNPNAHRIMAMFGEVNRTDDLWDLGPETQVIALFGEVKLDIRMARLVEGENVLRVQAIFGEVGLTVPQGMDVTIHSSAQFGAVSTPKALRDDARRDFPVQPVGRRLTIYATATFGEVNIRTV